MTKYLASSCSQVGHDEKFKDSSRTRRMLKEIARRMDNIRRITRRGERKEKAIGSWWHKPSLKSPTEH